MLESRKYDHGVQFCQIYWSVLPYVNDAIFGGFSLKNSIRKVFRETRNLPNCQRCYDLLNAIEWKFYVFTD